MTETIQDRPPAPPEQSVLDQDWENVTLKVFYIAREGTDVINVRVNRAEVEANEKEKARQEAATADQLQQIEDYVLGQDQFRGMIMGLASKYATAPVQVEGARPHEIVMLPPRAVLRVEVSVDNLASGIVIPGG